MPKKDYSETLKTLGEHLKKRRKEPVLPQRAAAEMIGVSADTVANWEKGKTKPVSSQFKPIATFLGYDKTPVPTTLAKHVEAKRRRLGATMDQVARYLRWEGSLRGYLKDEWQLSPERADALEQFLNRDRASAAAVLAKPRRKRQERVVTPKPIEDVAKKSTCHNNRRAMGEILRMRTATET